jgi:catechol 2,3-dioxygenase-like lactoylglutathione lyase family enzyme
MIVLVAIMVVTAFYIWNEDRKLPKAEEYGYEAFTAEDFEYWMQ